MTVQFQRFYCGNASRPQITEDVFRVYFGTANIHDFLFKSAYKADSVTFAPGGSGWRIQEVDATMPLDQLVRYTAPAGECALLMSTPKATASGYIIGFDSGDHPFVAYGSDTYGFTTVYTHPSAVAHENCEVTVASRFVYWGEKEVDKWYSLSMWVNDRVVLSWMAPIAPFTSAVGFTFGLAVKGGASKTFTNINAPQMQGFVEWNSLDPGEFIIGGLQRALEGRYIKMFVRHDGSVNAHRPIARDPDIEIGDDEDLIEDNSRTVDRRQLINHVRMVGAYTEAEAVDLSMDHHRFAEFKNPFLMTQWECALEAQKQLIRQKEMSDQFTITLPFRPLWEPEDLIRIDGEDWIVNDISFSYPATNGVFSVNMRRYYGAT